MATYQSKILARSPFYITATGSVYITSAILKVYIWSGSSASKPASATYTKSKNALSATSTDIIFEISGLIRDYFEHNSDAYTDALSSFTDVLWVETELDVVQSTDPQPSTVNNIYLALDAYEYFSNGVNPSDTDIVSTLNILSGNDVLLPVYSHSDGIDSVEWIKDSIVQTTTDLSTKVSSLFSYDKLQYLTNSDVADTIKTYKSTVLQQTISVNYIEECKYTPKEVKFYNKGGALQKIYMFTLSKENINVQKESYKSILGSVVSGNYTYDTTGHQNKDYNITAKESITLNSGFVGEEQNEIFKQILLSEFVWVDDKPVNVRTNGLEYKTHLNDRLINYTIDFDYSNDVINNVY